MKLTHMIGIASLTSLLACGDDVHRTIDGYDINKTESGNEVVYTIHRPDGYTCTLRSGQNMELAQRLDQERTGSTAQHAYASLPVRMVPILLPIINAQNAQIVRNAQIAREHEKIDFLRRAERLAAMSQQERDELVKDCYTILGRYQKVIHQKK